MFDLKKKYETSKKLEQNGVWVKLPGGAVVKIARWGNDHFSQQLEKLFADYPDVDGLGIEENRRLMDEYVISKTVLLDWKDIAEDGQPVTYSPEKAVEYLQMTDFRDEVIEEAKKRDRYLMVNESKAAEQLKKP